MLRVRLDHREWERLENEAIKNEISMSQVIRNLLKTLDKKKQKEN